jgi:hypothetical protein
MRIREHSAGVLVIEDKPWLETLVAVLCVAGGAWAFAGGERALGGGFAIAGAVIILGFANTTTIRFDRGTSRFTRSIKGLIRNRSVTHPLDHVARVEVEASASGSPSRSYRVSVVLKSRERVPLTWAYSSGRAGKEQLAAAIRRFLNLPPDDGAGMPGFGEMVKLMREP